MQLTDKQVQEILVECRIKVWYKDVDVVRELAKRPEMRMRWNVSKASGTPIFRGCVSDWTFLQQRLIYWCSFYGSIEQAYERPPDRVIQNNKLLDSWLESKAKENSDKYESDWAKGSAKVSKSAYDQDEVWEL